LAHIAINIYKSFKWLLSVGSAHAPHKNDIANFETKALEFMNILKEEFSETLIKDYEHLLVKHVPAILKAIFTVKIFNFNRSMVLVVNFPRKALSIKIKYQSKISINLHLKEEDEAK
jgi:hypothetical protein